MDETTWDVTEGGTEAEAVETVDATTPATEATEDAAEATETETVETATEADPYAAYRDAHGLIGGKYQTPEDAVKAAVEADRVIAQKEFERRQAQEMLDRYAPQRGGNEINPLTDLAPLLRVPPSNLLGNQAFITFGESKDVAWQTDEDGFILTNDPLNIVNMQFVRDLMKEEVGTASQRQQQAQEAEAAAERQFYTAYPELNAFSGIVDTVASELAQAGRLTGSFEQNAALVAQMAKARATPSAAKLLGHAGGTATATRQAVSPVGGTGRAGAGGAVEKDECEW